MPLARFSAVCDCDSESVYVCHPCYETCPFFCPCRGLCLDPYPHDRGICHGRDAFSPYRDPDLSLGSCSVSNSSAFAAPDPCLDLGLSSATCLGLSSGRDPSNDCVVEGAYHPPRHGR